MTRVALWSSNCRFIATPQAREFERGLEFCVNNSADCLILPETTFSGFSPSKGRAWAKAFDEETRDSMKALADRYGITMLYGSWTLGKAGNLRNVARVVSPHAAACLDISKRHPFSFMNEDAYIKPSSETGVVELLPGVPVLIALCYDLRFPGIYWHAAPHVLLMITISSWPLMRSRALKTMLSSRAVENQCFSIGVNRSGFDDEGTTFGGERQVYDFHGRALRPVVAQEGISIFRIKLDLVQEWRNVFPALRDRDAQVCAS